MGVGVDQSTTNAGGALACVSLVFLARLALAGETPVNPGQALSNGTIDARAGTG